MDENNRRFLELNATQFQRPQRVVLETPREYSQSSENEPTTVFADGSLAPEFHLNENAAACHSFVGGGNSRQIDAPHPVDAATVVPQVALHLSVLAMTHLAGRFPLVAWLN